MAGRCVGGAQPGQGGGSDGSPALTAGPSDELGGVRPVRHVDLERLRADVVPLDEVPVGLGQFVGVEERLRLAVGLALAGVGRVDLMYFVVVM